MKKTICYLLICVLLLSSLVCFIGCDDSATETKTNQTQSAQTKVQTTKAVTTTKKECSHDWKSATCSAPKTCSLCGKTEGSPEHTWSEATCTSPKTCTICNATDGKALGHSYTNNNCSRCGKNALCTKNYSGTSVPDFGSMFSPFLSPTSSHEGLGVYFYSLPSLHNTEDFGNYRNRYEQSLNNNGFYLDHIYFDDNDVVHMYYNSRNDDIVAVTYDSTSPLRIGVNITIV